MCRTVIIYGAKQIDELPKMYTEELVECVVMV